MPIKQGYTTKNGKRMGYYQWGDGKKYYYTPGNDASRRAAKSKARKQQQAAYANGYAGRATG